MSSNLPNPASGQGYDKGATTAGRTLSQLGGWLTQTMERTSKKKVAEHVQDPSSGYKHMGGGVFYHPGTGQGVRLRTSPRAMGGMDHVLGEPITDPLHLKDLHDRYRASQSQPEPEQQRPARPPRRLAIASAPDPFTKGVERAKEVMADPGFQRVPWEQNSYKGRQTWYHPGKGSAVYVSTKKGSSHAEEITAEHELRTIKDRFESHQRQQGDKNGGAAFIPAPEPKKTKKAGKRSGKKSIK